MHDVMAHSVSTVALAMLYAGLYFRKRNTALHWKLMAAAFAVDLLLVLAIEINRKAIEQSLEIPGGILGLHIAVSALTLLLYVVMMVLGRRLITGHEAWRAAHRYCGVALIVARSVNYVTSYLVT